MGIIISRFRKKKNTVEELEDIEDKIKSIEKYQKETEQQFRKIIVKFLLSSVGVYVLSLIVFYYYYSRDAFKENLIIFLPLIMFPVLVFLTRMILSWYYKRKLSKNEVQLKNLKNSKKKILEDVMDKEIYKVAKEILEKYAPEQLRPDISINKLKANYSFRSIIPTDTIKSEMNPRHRINSNVVMNRKNDVQPATPVAIPRRPVSNMNLSGQPRLSLPRPILPRDRGAFDKLVDMIIGDGPNNRYALICRFCCSHNGMALKNDFEYLAFRCAYCWQFNPAKKLKPHAPHLVSYTGSPEVSDIISSEPEDINESVQSDSTDLKNNDFVTDESSLLVQNSSTQSLNETTDSNEDDKIVDSAENCKFNMSTLKEAINELNDESSKTCVKLLGSDPSNCTTTDIETKNHTTTDIEIENCTTTNIEARDCNTTDTETKNCIATNIESMNCIIEDIETRNCTTTNTDTHIDDNTENINESR